MAGLRDLARAYGEVRFYAISRDLPAESHDLAGKIARDGRGAVSLSLLSDPRSEVIDRYGLRDPAYAGEKIDGVPRPSVFVLDLSGRPTRGDATTVCSSTSDANHAWRYALATLLG